MEKQQTRTLIIRLALYLTALLPLMILRDFTPNNELKYLSIADEALANGHLFCFYNHGVLYADKPPLYLWIVMFCRRLFGGHYMLPLTLFSVLPALGIVAVMDRWVSRFGDTSRQTLVSGELSMVTSLYFAASSLVVRMDMLMLFFIVLALYTFYRMYMGEDSLKLKLAFPLYTFLALFTKGPVGMLVPLVAVPVFLLSKRALRTWGRYWGWITWGVLALLCAGWFTAVWFEGGDEYLGNLLFHQTIDRAANAFHHKQPLWYYLGTIWYLAFPWSFLQIGVIAYALVRKRVAGDLERFFLLTSLSFLVLMSLFSSKLDVYLLPMLPFTAYLTFMLLPKVNARWIPKVALWIPAVIFTSALPLVAIGQFVLKTPLAQWWAYAIGAVMTAAGAVSIIALCRADILKTARRMAAGFIATIFVAGAVVYWANSLFGWSYVVESAAKSAKEMNIDHFGSYNLRSGENIDALLGKPVEVLDEPKPTVVPMIMFHEGLMGIAYSICLDEDDGIDTF